MVDPGHGTAQQLFQQLSPHQVDAVFISHGHADHCADLNALLSRAPPSRDRAAAAADICTRSQHRRSVGLGWPDARRRLRTARVPSR
ncbi:MAG: MBL fold metallo-hydrolase [Mycobacterium sp.]